MGENKEYLSPLEEMNEILTRKEAVIDSKLEELRNYHKELKEFENQLSEKAAEVKKAQDEVALEKERINQKWDEIHSYEESLQTSMAHVLAEKVELEKRSVSDLESLLNSEEILEEQSVSSNFNLNALRQSVGIDVPKYSAEDASQEKHIETVVEEVVPEIYKEIQQEILKKFRSPKPYVLEESNQFLCMQIGTRELRVFDNGVDEKNPRPVIHLIIGHKNARNDSKLQRKLASLGRVLPDWDFLPMENQLLCMYYYEKNQDAKSLISKLKECIEKVEE